MTPEAFRKRVFLVGGILLAMMLAVSAVLFTREISRIQEEKTRRSEVMGELPDFALVSQNGRSVGRSDLLGRVHVVNFFYTSCTGPSPVLTKKMAGLQEAWLDEQDIGYMSITVDPERDTPTVLASYAAENGAREGWVFLTGETERVHDVIRPGFRSPVYAISGAEAIHHSLRFALLDKRGRVRAHLDAASPTLVADAAPIVKRLLAEN